MRKSQRFAFLAIGGLGLLAAIAPGLAAGIQINTPSSGTPAAGQGSIEVQGFVVEGINWTVTNEGKVEEVTFNIFRDGDSKPTSSVLGANATVRVLLDTTGALTVNSTWSDCALPANGTTGLARCETIDEDVDANDLNKVQVLAFDSN
jgi:hypothetical protein